MGEKRGVMRSSVEQDFITKTVIETIGERFLMEQRSEIENRYALYLESLGTFPCLHSPADIFSIVFIGHACRRREILIFKKPLDEMMNPFQQTYNRE